MKNLLFPYIDFRFDTFFAINRKFGTLLLSRTKATYVVLVLCLLSFVFLPSSLHSQTIPPPYINYQAVLYDVNNPSPNAVFANQSFQTFVNINDELGNLLYREEHFASTDGNGLITVKMGDGLYVAGPITNFNQIDWGTGKYYLVVDFNINGTISSTAPEQLVTVPYSFYSGKAGNGMTAVADNGNGTLTFTYANGSTYTTPTLSGIQGPTGATGPVGPVGASGASGQSAYDLWLAQGNTGTVQDFLNTLVGPQGAIGLTGPVNTYVGGNGISITNDTISVNQNEIASLSQGIRVGFTASTTWLCPPGVSQITVELWGGGGGGGPPYISCYSCLSSSGNSGGLGGKGGYNSSIVSVIPGNVYTITIGSGGSPGSSNVVTCYPYQVLGGSTCIAIQGGGAGQNGGISSFHGILSAPGGSGGGSATSGSSGTNGLNGIVTNWNHPTTNYGSRSYVPMNYLTAHPSNFALGGSGSLTYPTAGEFGYCIISY
jgi:hypothetical protein